MMTLFQLGTLGLPDATLEAEPDAAANVQMLVTVHKEDTHVPIVTIAWQVIVADKPIANVISTEYTHRLGWLHRSRWLGHLLTSPGCMERNYLIDDGLALLATIYDQVEKIRIHQRRERGLPDDERSSYPSDAISRHGQAHQTVY